MKVVSWYTWGPRSKRTCAAFNVPTPPTPPITLTFFSSLNQMRKTRDILTQTKLREP